MKTTEPDMVWFFGTIIYRMVCGNYPLDEWKENILDKTIDDPVSVRIIIYTLIILLFMNSTIYTFVVQFFVSERYDLIFCAKNRALVSEI